MFDSINIVPSKGGAPQVSVPRKKRHKITMKQTILLIPFSTQFGFECFYPFFKPASKFFLFRFRFVGLFRHFPKGYFLKRFDSFLQLMPLLHIIDLPGKQLPEKQDIPTGIDPQTLYIPLRIVIKKVNQKKDDGNNPLYDLGPNI